LRRTFALAIVSVRASMRVEYAMRVECSVEGESPGAGEKFFEARESVRVSLALKFADVAQVAERESSNLDVTGSNPVFRSTFRCTFSAPPSESSERASYFDSRM
jgi:hypothetical protein